jgi:DNA helicase-2/ATP-dependent DNA helicase PcrA
VRGQSAGGDRHVYAPRTRFIAERDLDCFEVRTLPRAAVETHAVVQQAPVIDLKAAMRSMWSD